MKRKLLFLTLNTFSATGGIEKVCRVAAKALAEIAAENGSRLRLFAMYDRDGQADSRYLAADLFRGFGGSRARFVLAAVREGIRSDTVVLSHVNLLSVGFLIKKFSPSTKIHLIAHGIEVWDAFPTWKNKMLAAVDLFLPVSNFTATKLMQVHDVPAKKLKVFNNCLDPFLENGADLEKEQQLRKQYGFAPSDFVLLTLTRLKFSEQYKGYDKVMQAIARLRNSHPSLKYLIVGRYDAAEKARLDQIIAENGIGERVVFAGFVNDEDLAAHFNIANAYIMPSSGEGFGVVFIEALFYGKPVIAGNIDGSVDALLNGQFGYLVNPNSLDEIIGAIDRVAALPDERRPDERLVQEHFGYETYRRRWKKLVLETSQALGVD